RRDGTGTEIRRLHDRCLVLCASCPGGQRTSFETAIDGLGMGRAAKAREQEQQGKGTGRHVHGEVSRSLGLRLGVGIGVPDSASPPWKSRPNSKRSVNFNGRLASGTAR